MSRIAHIKQGRGQGKQKPLRIPIEESSEDGSSTESDLNDSSGAESSEDNEKSSSARPRMSQWVDEDDDTVVEDAAPAPRKSIKEELASLSFGAIMRAKNVLARQTQEESPSNSDASSNDTEEGDDDEDSDEQPVAGTSHSAERERVEKKHKEKRANKHAPMEMSSKRPVSRKRTVVDTSSIKYRDPRFGGAVGDFSSDHFRKDYGFLSELRTQELEAIKRDLSRAKRLLANSPAHLRDERRIEAEKLERTMKRTESTIERGNREAFECDVMLKVKRDERLKRSEGKKEWYFKKSDERKLKLKARFESMSGKEVKKRIVKKQKKLAQQDKRSRPFFGGDPKRQDEDTRGSVGGAKRRDPGRGGDGASGRPRKRRRLDD
ncbi:rRNA biogenesis protein rrp36 [Serendipita sp. 399]|nr:rRNA biogenesis protein rrp36 [Serendipita sp. 399]